MKKKQTTKITLLIIIIAILAIINIVFFLVPFSYQASEFYNVQEPYNFRESYSVPYDEEVASYERVPYTVEDTENVKLTYRIINEDDDWEWIRWPVNKQYIIRLELKNTGPEKGTFNVGVVIHDITNGRVLPGLQGNQQQPVVLDARQSKEIIFKVEGIVESNFRYDLTVNAPTVKTTIQETKYRTEIEYKTETKYRTEWRTITKYRTVQKELLITEKGTLYELVSGNRQYVFYK